MKTEEPEFDYLKAEPSIRDQLIRLGVSALVGFIAEALAKSAYDRFVINRHHKVKIDELE
jgi:hypothetical protein